jgi:hypothetical protein
VEDAPAVLIDSAGGGRSLGFNGTQRLRSFSLRPGAQSSGCRTLRFLKGAGFDV